MTDFIIIFLFVATTIAAHPRRCPIILIFFFSHFCFMRLETRRAQREMEEKDRKQFNSLFHVKSADSTSVVERKTFSLFLI